MEWTITQVIGHNVRTRRDSVGMTAAALGEKIGEVFGKPWPRQTVYMMENGDRAMVAQEVTALSKILGVSIGELFTPPSEVTSVGVGTLNIDAEELVAPVSDSADMDQVARAVRALDNSQKALQSLVHAQYVLVWDAKNAILGKPQVQLAEEESIFRDVQQIVLKRADEFYDDDNSGVFKDPGAEVENDGEGK